MITVTRISQISGEVNTMELDVTQDQMDAYMSQRIPLIQNAFPNLPVPEREFIKSGITPKEWEETFGTM